MIQDIQPHVLKNEFVPDAGAREDGLLFLFDFHATYSEQNFFLPCHTTGEGKYQVILSTDEPRFGGTGLVDHGYVYQTEYVANRGTGFYIYAPARTAMVLKKV